MARGSKLAIAVFLVCTTSGAVAAERGFYVGAALGKAEQHIDSTTFTFMRFVPPGTPVTSSTTIAFNDDTDGVSWNATLGYRVNRFVAAELSYADFGNTTVSPDLPPLVIGTVPTIPVSGVIVGGFLVGVPTFAAFASSIVPANTKVGVTGPVVSALGSLPVTTNLSAYLRAGVLFADKDVDVPAFFRELPVQGGTGSIADEVWLAGVGAEWSFGSRWSGRLEYQRTGDIEGNAFVSESHLTQYSLTVLFRFAE